MIRCYRAEKRSEKDNTEPKSLESSSQVTSWQVLSIAIPMTFAYLTTPLLGIVNAAVIGQIGESALIGGLAAGTVIFDVVIATFNFLGSTTSCLVAQAFGRGRAQEGMAVFSRTFGIAAICGLGLFLLAPVVAAAGSQFLSAEQPVTDAMLLYIRIRLISAPLVLINYTILGFFLGSADARLAFGLTLLLNGMNALLSVLLGLWLNLGIAGVAWAAVCSDAAAMIAGLAFLLVRFRSIPRISRAQMFNVVEIVHLLQFSGDIMTRSFLLVVAYFLMVRQGAQLGTLSLAANAVLLNLFLVSVYFLDGFSAATQQLVARAIGARNRPAFLQAIVLSASWGFGLAGFASLLIVVWGEGLINLLVTADDVRSVALSYLPWAALAVLAGMLASQMNGIFIGAAWSRDVRNMMSLSFVTFVVAVFSLGHQFGNHGLWAAFNIFLLMRGISLLCLMSPRVRAAFSK